MQSPNCIVVGHSLGGIIAWHIAQHNQNIIKGASITTPFGGFSMTSLRLPLFFMPTIIPNMLQELDRNNWFSSQPRNNKSRVPWVNIVGNKGMFTTYENDGVLTTKSQKELYYDEENVTWYVLPYTHMEITHADEIYDLIRR